MKVKYGVWLCLLAVLFLPAAEAKAGSGTVHIDGKESYAIKFSNLVEGDTINFLIEAVDTIDVCINEEREYKNYLADRPWDCAGARFAFGEFQAITQAAGTFEIPNVEKYDDDWVIMLLNEHSSSTSVTFDIEVLSTGTYSGEIASLRTSESHSGGILELDRGGGAVGIIFEQVVAASQIGYEFTAEEPVDLYIFIEEEWTLLTEQMGWEYAYSDVEAMRSRGSYRVPVDANWAVAFVNYGSEDVNMVYQLTVTEPTSSPPAANSVTAEGTVFLDSALEQGSQVNEPASSQETQPTVPELMNFVPAIVVTAIVSTLMASRKRTR